MEMKTHSLLDARICVVEAVHVIVFADGEVLSGLRVMVSSPPSEVRQAPVKLFDSPESDKRSSS
jgi:hypothetical protein